MTDPIRRRTGGRSARVREAVLSATLEALADNGFDQLSIGLVAERAGVHETSIYRRWKSRDRLIFDALLEHSEQHLPVPDTGSLRGDLVEFNRALVAIVESPLGTALGRVMAGGIDDPELAAARADFWHLRMDAAQIMLDRAVARGELSAAPDPWLVLETLTAPVHFRKLLTREPFDDGYAERVVDLVLNGLLPEGKTR
ncbi:TetR/AcrR family transcriptional regulator [Nocardia seriolae]|uniref:HTH-type transcriptional regulator n=1 Tax=Nocardia seriolae TaxID=37332 RepID=A0A0B8NLT5_9NOCA|nr:TetR/AcrR family transcriptional regulator [Nocardia seriolae]APA95782.1 putative HTH-type transcriptional regulator [Nocardia seriolae]MTJ66102.1 TetR family transcriptional regulator [Nocardia seriolae]MTJ74106.1 TetR family transcriptional regulator [Nocardia seriolae]MTJ85981.1 TetR family transcriptional regulator [Nocardia seriolae]MTK29975.1 TetR family transcriptional regulator [Nocardia seriolae]